MSDVNTNWIGVFKQGDPVDSAHDQKWAYAPNLNGTAELDISSLAAGSYNAYYFYNDGWTQLAGPVSFTVAGHALSLDQHSYSKGTTNLTATYSEDRWPDPNNWIGIFKAGDPVDSAHLISGDWNWASYSSGTTNVPISNLSAGTYSAYMLWQNGYYQLSGPVNFTIIPKYDHVFMIMLENTPYNGVYSDVTSTPSNMPNLKYYKSQGTWFSDYHAVTHPSDENYTAIAGGDTYRTGGVYFPSFNDPNTSFAQRLDSAGKVWRAYAEGNGPTGCNTSSSQNSSWDPNTGKDSTPWYPDDEPFVNYNYVVGNPPTSTNYCQQHVFDTQHYSTASHDLADDLSNNTVGAFNWVSADDWDNGEHSGNGTPASRAVQDAWLGTTVNQIMSSSAWTTQNSLLIITWDEDYAYTANNQVPALVLGSSGVTANKISSNSYTHYSTGATIEDALSFAPITNNDRGATPLVDAFTP